MTYDTQKHITHAELAKHMGVVRNSLTATIKRVGGPRIEGSLDIGQGQSMRYYDRAKALAWVDGLDAKTPKKEIVPPRNLSELERLRARASGGKEYGSGPQMSINQARAAELYPNRLYTPAGIGNGLEFAPGFDRGR